jgi:nucleoside-diphosphate-sugar epimerase
MRIFLTGGTGAVGRPTLPLLVAAGHEVTAVARGPEKAAQVEAAGATPAEVDLFDAVAVVEAVAGHDAVVNLATSIPPITKAMRPSAWAANDRLRREASAYLIDAALTAGATRFVQESIVFVYPSSGDRWLDAETTEPDAPGILASALAAESQTARFTAGGGAGVVLRFGYFYGPGLPHTETFLRLARWGLGMSPGAAGDYTSSIHVDDAGAAVVAALGAPAGVYDVVDDRPLTRREYAAALVAAAGRSHHVRVPGPLIRLTGAQGQVTSRSQRVSNRRFKEATGWAPRWPSATEGLAATCGRDQAAQ